jgi:hypothetical protein
MPLPDMALNISDKPMFEEPTHMLINTSTARRVVRKLITKKL